MEDLSLVAIFQNPGDADGLEDNGMEIGNKDKHQEAHFNNGNDKGPAQVAAESFSSSNDHDLPDTTEDAEGLRERIIPTSKPVCSINALM